MSYGDVPVDLTQKTPINNKFCCFLPSLCITEEKVIHSNSMDIDNYILLSFDFGLWFFFFYEKGE